MKLFGSVTTSSSSSKTKAKKKNDIKKDEWTAGAGESASLGSHANVNKKVQSGSGKKGSFEKKEFCMDIDLLLKMDVSTLNAKQRRLLKRHEEQQKPKEQQSPDETANNTTKVENDEKTSGSSKKKETKKSDENNSNDDDDDDNDSSSSSSDDDDESEDSSDEEPNKKESNTTSSKPQKDESKLSSGDIPSEIQEIAKLNPTERNSKQRRQLKRFIDREGTKDGLELYENTHKTADNEKGDDNKKESSSGQQSSSKKRKRQKKDTSNLSKEEIERRQEQARRGKEIRELRAKGLIQLDGRHPLNSERRRANRRKPSKAGMLAAMKRQKNQ